MKHFYSEVIETESIYLELDSLNLSDSEKTHLKKLIDSSIHHAVLDTIMSELSEQEKKIFLSHLAVDDHDKIWKHLKSNITDIEKKIFETTEKIKKELQKDIDETKQEKGD